MTWADHLIVCFAFTTALSAVALKIIYKLYVAEVIYVPALRSLYSFVRRFI